MSLPSTSSAQVESFFHRDTGTFTHLVYEGDGGAAAIIDSVLDYDAAAARTGTAFADSIIACVRQHRLHVEWILETHAHADHLSAGGYLHDVLGAPLAIGRGITQVQTHFKHLFGLGDNFIPDGRQFDRLFDDGDDFHVGALAARAIATPGHTGDSLTYLIGDAAFVGDTLFAPDTGTARCDFPGGDATQLYRSIQTLLALPPETRIFLCHDYPSAARAPMAETRIGTQLQNNVHMKSGVSEADFVAMRIARDATLAPPRLILPALQVNIRGGRLPTADSNGIAYLKLPLNRLGKSGP
jgi:glyoxylase-like metal-dependent hydrolase (beta-lactamase superfamily II)